MELKALKPRKALNKAFLKLKPNRSDIESFKSNLKTLIDRSNPNESEEFHKNLITEFLRKTYYQKSNNFINTKGRNDLVIYNGKDSKSSVGVIIEAKKTSNKSEMLRKDNINVKAFHELILYYLRERITEKNLDVKHIIATNINEWFVFEANVFEKLFANNKKLVKQFTDFEQGRLSGKSTDFFYSEIAKPFVENIESEISFTHFNLQDYEKFLRNDDQKDDIKLIALFKLFSPEHLLKLPFANDSNTLDKRFYAELLHIIGLEETKEGSKKLIKRRAEKQRSSGSIIENTINQLDSLDKIHRLERPGQFGATQEERLFNVAMELTITWINRILFLKLLEAQLIKYHKGNKDYSFLNLKKIKNYNYLNTLFFQVLAREHKDRNSEVKDKFEKVPFLNSSLFEPNELEHQTLLVSNLNDDKKLPIYSSTVLKDSTGKKRKGEITALEYLFEFLDAYDFSSEGAEDIQEENKTLINASVLGLIFEKINGYKDGSFFTPGFITMYMCRETIRRAVVQKFNDEKGWNCESINDIFNKDLEISEANKIVNSIKICDPAVGSGHFLVSALNEIIAVKNDLKILTDRQGKRLKYYNIEVVNDELIVTDEDGELFEYNPTSKESQRIQETLFHEKQTIIENCLFGVDINPNSVKICRLRLWIELLKNAYYKNDTELETLPNIDINIKCGNSLISRFPLDADLGRALKQSKWTVDSYRMAVQTYRNAENKEQKSQMVKLINDIKSDFRSEISKNDPKMKRLNKLKGELFAMTNQIQMFERSKKEQAEWDKQLKKLSADIPKLEAEIEEIRSNKIYENAFEWRFEFPEVLDSEGRFLGFDVVMGNPPYIRQEDFKCIKPYLSENFSIFNSTADILTYFVEKAYNILKDNGVFQFIISNKFTRANYGKELRQFLHAKTMLTHYIDFSGVPVFDEASVDAAILGFVKHTPIKENTLVQMQVFKNNFSHDCLFSEIIKSKHQYKQHYLNESAWIFENEVTRKIKLKVEHNTIKLKELDLRMYYGIKTGFNNAFIIDTATYNYITKLNPKSKCFIKPMLRGQDIKQYYIGSHYKWLINIPKGYTIKNILKIQGGDILIREPIPRYGYVEYEEAWNWFKNELPSIAEHLVEFREQAEKRIDKGDYWWELRACAYLKEFEKPKIIYKDIAQRLTFCYDENAYFTNNTNYFITGNVNLKYLTAILNSKLIDYYYRLISTQLGENVVRLFTQYVENIPVKQISEKEEKKFADIIDKIIIAKSNLQDTTSLESQIDRIVYDLYGLTEEEIGIIENG